jgi:thioredoxin
MTTQLTVEVLTASECSRCQRAKALAKEVIAKLDDDRLQYREINVIEEIDYAVALGVLSTPAIALNGELVFPSPPSAAKLRQAILERLGSV